MLLAIIFAWFGYKKANAAGRNGVLWAFIALATFIGTQMIVWGSVGIVLAIGEEAYGWSDTILDEYDTGINLIAIAVSLIPSFIVLSYVSRVPEEESEVELPPPPEFS